MELQSWHIFIWTCCASLEERNNLTVKREGEKRDADVTKACVNHLLSLTPTTNQFLHHIPRFNGCFPQPQTHQFISDRVMTNYKPFLCWGFIRAALVGAPHATCLEMKGGREPNWCQEQTTHSGSDSHQWPYGGTLLNSLSALHCLIQ